VRALLERVAAQAWPPPPCPECRRPMSLERDTQVFSTPPVFEAVWRCVVCGESMQRCRVFDAIH
jgi:hypothetical protein